MNEKQRKYNRERVGKYYEDNPEKKIEVDRRYRNKHLKETRECCRKWRKLNPERVRKYNNKYYEEHPEKFREYSKKYSQEHLEKVREYKKKWEKKHHERRKKISREYQKKKNSTIKGRIDNRMHTAIYLALRKNKAGRTWKSLVDYTLEQFKQHFQKLFTKGMNWTKFMNGKIHIGHVVPINYFNFSSTDDSQFKECWSLHNLKPQWAKENLSKGDRQFQVPLPLWKKESGK